MTSCHSVDPETDDVSVDTSYSSPNGHIIGGIFGTFGLLFVIVGVFFAIRKMIHLNKIHRKCNSVIIDGETVV